MFVLHLVFVLSTAPMEERVFERRALQFETQAACVAAMQWWIDHPEAEFDGMDPAFRLLIKPIPAWDCQAQAPAIG
jgi:hypothetical protein